MGAVTSEFINQPGTNDQETFEFLIRYGPAE
jgi:hypothetical protein